MIKKVMSHRAEQVAEVLKHEFNNFLIKEAEPPRDLFITVTQVSMTDDLENAFISISVIPVNKAGSALDYLKKVSGEAGRYLAKHMVARIVPKLHFKIDEYELKHRNVERALEEEL